MATDHGWNVSSKSAGAGLYDALADRSQMSLGRKDREVLYVLVDVLLEDLLFTQLAMPAENEFSQGIRQSFLGDAIPLWFVFAHRIYLDIYRILREQIDRGLKELRVAKLSEGLAEESFREEFVEEDEFSKMKEQIYSEPLTGPLDRPYDLLSQHPL